MIYLIFLSITSLIHLSTQLICSYSSCKTIALNCLLNKTCNSLEIQFYIGNFSQNEFKYFLRESQISILNEIIKNLQINELEIEPIKVNLIFVDILGINTYFENIYFVNSTDLNTSAFVSLILDQTLQKLSFNSNKDKSNFFVYYFKKIFKFSNLYNNKIKFISLKINKNLKLHYNSMEFISRVRRGGMEIEYFRNKNLTESSTLYLNELKLNSLKTNTIYRLQDNFLSQLNNSKQVLFSNYQILESNKTITRKKKSKMDMSFRNIDKIDFKIPISLTELRISHNKIQNLSLKNTQFLTNLNFLDISNNLIDTVQFSESFCLLILDLSHNLIKFINVSSFSGLYELRNLYLTNNLIYNIERKSFVQNIYLKLIYLDSNNITSIPNINKLKNLNFLNLRSQRAQFIKIQNFAFDVKLTNQDLHVYLEENPNIFFDDKCFCFDYSKDKYSSNLHFYLDDLNALNKCHFQQLKNSSINTLSKANCGIVALSQNVGLFFNFKNTNLCDKIDFKLKCENTNFQCETKNKYSTWIGLDAEVYSYLRNFQKCGIKNEFLCFKFFNFLIFCEFDYSNVQNKTILVLIKVKIDIFYDGIKITIPIENIFQLNTFKYEKIFNYLGFELKKNENFIILEKDHAEIYIIKYFNFFGLILKADHQFYSKIEGILLEGC